MKIRTVFGILGGLLSIVLIAWFPQVIDQLFHFIEAHLSPDHSLETDTEIKITFLFSGIIVLFLGSSVITALNLFGVIRRFLESMTGLDLVKLNTFLFSDTLCRLPRFPVVLFTVSSALAVIFHSVVLFHAWPAHEGPLDMYTTQLFLVAVIFLVVSVFNLNVLFPVRKERKRIVISLLAIAAVSLLFYLEEISWGQQIFHWSSPAFFTTWNYQQETNLHNFFNPVFDFLYPLFGMGIFLVLSGFWAFGTRHTSSCHLLMPPGSLYFLFFALACSSFRSQFEIFEVLAGIVMAAYSLRIFICLKFPRNDTVCTE